MERKDVSLNGSARQTKVSSSRETKAQRTFSSKEEREPGDGRRKGGLALLSSAHAVGFTVRTSLFSDAACPELSLGGRPTLAPRLRSNDEKASSTGAHFWFH